MVLNGKCNVAAMYVMYTTTTIKIAGNCRHATPTDNE